jgi:hypothetical protein
MAMADRTALLICCSELEAKTIRAQAKTKRRTVSGPQDPFSHTYL